jgi:hypothetical protein
VLTLDENGFRRSVCAGSIVDSSTWLAETGRPRGLLLGSSVAFGYGASSDATTLASVLSSLRGHPYLNVAVCAANSTQELIGCIPFLLDADEIVICSGINTLAAALHSLGLNELFGPLFFEGALERLGRTPFGTTEATRSIRERDASAARADPNAARPLPIGPDVEHSAARALARQVRDLTLLARAANPSARVLFAAQPYATILSRQAHENELRLAELGDAVDKARLVLLDRYLCDLWPGYADELRRACERIGVAFLDLNELPFEGWCFIDRVHLTDRGYAQAARAIMETLS